MIDETDTMRMSLAPLRTLVRRFIPDLSAGHPIAGIVVVFLGLVSVTPVVVASNIALDAGSTSEPVADVPPAVRVDGGQPCAPGSTTTVVPTTTVFPTETVVPTTTTTVDPTTTTTVVSTTTTTTVPTETVVPTTTVSLTESTTLGVEPCDDPSTDPPVPAPPSTVGPATSPETSPEPSPAVSPDGTAPAPEASATAAEAPPVAANDITTPDDTSAGETAVTPPASPPVITPPVIEAVTPPVIPAVSATWTTGVTRSGTPRKPGPSALQPGRTPAGQRVMDDQIEVILTTIRQLESGSRYNVGPNAAKASGAYQYIPSTWRNEGGYPDAYLAPSEIQDARARSDVERFLAMYGGDVSMVPVMWYYPRAASDPKWMDRVPNPAGGNRLTIREYQARWMERFARNAQDLLRTYGSVPDSPAAVSVLTGFPEPPDGAEFDHRISLAVTAVAAAVAAAATQFSRAAKRESEAAPFVLNSVTVSDRTVEFAARAVPPEVTEPHDAGSMRPVVFPVLGPVVYANSWGDPRDGGARRHEGTDIIGVTMQPLLAATDGQITQLRLEPRGRSGAAISIRDADGWRYNYFHANNDTPATDDGEADDGFRLAPGLELGDEVVAGQIIGYLGDSGNAEDSVPHLHFEFRDPEGRPAPSYWSLRVAEARQACTIGIGPWSTPSLTPDVDLNTVEQVAADSADPLEPAAVELERAVWHTIVSPMYGEGQWVIDSDGRVTATGDAALIMPSRTLECAPGPATPFGTDAAGWARFDHDALAGTVLENADLAGTVLENADLAVTALENADLTGILFDSMTPKLSAVEWRDPLLEPMVFTDPASGERIIVTFKPPPEQSTRLSTTFDRRAEGLDARRRRTAVPRI